MWAAPADSTQIAFLNPLKAALTWCPADPESCPRLMLWWSVRCSQGFHEEFEAGEPPAGEPGRTSRIEPTGAGGRGTETQEGQQHTGTSMASKVMDLIYWKDTERSGMVLTGLVVVLLSLFQLSIITVVSTLSLAVVCFAIAVRVYYKTLHILNWADGEHPFKKYLDMDIGLSGEQAEHAVQKAIVMAMSALDTLKKLVFVANLIDSLKFLVLLYLATFLGKIFNGLTVFIMGVIAIFSLPLFYQQRQEQVDSAIAKIQANVDNVKDIVRRILQGGGPTPDPTPGGAKPKTQ
uniref:Reticulon n=1 Tax=Gadus morhua TaxID=8049 RepID=A0A8C4ZTG9_GADMO